MADVVAPRRHARNRALRLVAGPAEGNAPLATARREQIYRRSLALSDVAAGALAFGITLVGTGSLQLASLLALPGIVLIAKIVGLYDRDELVIRKTTLEEAPALFQLATVIALVAWLASGPLFAGDLHQQQVAELWLALTILFPVGRVAARAVAARLSPAERCLVIGDEAAYASVGAKFRDNALNAITVGRIDTGSLPIPSNGTSNDFRMLQTVVERLEVHRLIVATHPGHQVRTLEVIRAAKGLGVRVSILPRMLEAVGSTTEFDDLFGLSLLGVRRFGLTRSSRALKRTFDVVGSGIAMLILAPAGVAIAIAIKLTSRGPVFYRQERVGRGGETFRIFKFRTMIDGAHAMRDSLRDRNETDGLFKIADDPRITSVGRILRRTSLDELPQLINVFKGEMSLVGPRPLVVDEDAKIEGWDRRRLDLTPGMTGYWQILGSARVPLAEMVKIDYRYVADWSLWADVKILLRTIPYVLARRGM